MLVPIDPKSLYEIHKDRERELERDIERMRTARANGPVMDRAEETRPAWFTLVVQSLKARLFRRARRLPETF